MLCFQLPFPFKKIGNITITIEQLLRFQSGES